jgi:DNA-binding transcriptional MerR regulator
MTPARLDIGDVVRASGVPVSTLHVWERKGLLAPVDRRGLRRQYGPEILDRVALIVIAQRAGFKLAEIAELVADDAFDDGKDRLEAKLDELRDRRRQLDAAISGIEHALACPHPSPVECPTFRTMLRDVLPVSGPGHSG